MNQLRRFWIPIGAAVALLLALGVLWRTRRLEPPEPQRTSTLGVQDITYTEDDLASAPRFMLSPEVVVFGGPDSGSDNDLTSVTSGAVLSDGRIATFAAPGQRLLLHDADGIHVHQIGSAGQGPGEFSGAVNLLGRAGDTLIVVDLPNRRVSWFWNGELVRTRSIETPLPMVVRQIRGQLPGDDLIVSSEGEFRDQGDRTPLIQPVTEIFRVFADGTARELFRIPGIEITSVRARFMGRDVVMTDFLRYGTRPHVAVQDSLIVTAIGSTFQLAFHDREGRPVRTLTVQTKRRAVTPAIRAAAVAAEFGEYQQLVREVPADRGAYERLIRDAPYADSMSVFESLHVTPDHLLWVVNAIAAGDSLWTATAFDPQGRIAGTLQGVASARPFAFGAGAVLLKRVDADGVTLLELHQLVREE